MTAVPTLELNNGKRIPAIGLGTSRIKQEEMNDVILNAIDAGYRHFDSSELYANAGSLGEALSAAMLSQKIKREELFITSKVGFFNNKPEAVKHALLESLQKLKLEYVDLYLVHFPLLYSGEAKSCIFGETKDSDLIKFQETADHIGVWKEMENLVETGLVKTIGLSNFNIKQIDNIVQNCRIRPSVIQTECHTYLQEKDLQTYFLKENIVMTAFAPLGSPGMNQYGITGGNILEDTTVNKIASRLDKSPAQILLRFLVKMNIGVIVKSSNPGRLKENITIFDFQLSSDDMDELAKLDRGGRIFTYLRYRHHPQYPYTS